MTLFVTVGTGKFEKLVKKIDLLVKGNIIKDKVLIQIGKGSYIPKHCGYFRFATNLNNYYSEASLIISHGGPGTVFEILRKKKRLIAVSNRDRTDPLHQVEFLEEISKTRTLIFCDDIANLEKCYHKAKFFKFEKYIPPEYTMDKSIIEFVNQI